MESNRATRWRSTIRAWLFNKGYVLAVDDLISMIEEELIRWGFDFDAAEAELRRTGRMGRDKKRASRDAFKFVLHLGATDNNFIRARNTVSLAFDPAAAEIEADEALQVHQESLTELFQAALRRLPPDLRILVRKRVCERATFQELADELGMSTGYVHNHFKIAIDLMTKSIHEARGKKRRA